MSTMTTVSPTATSSSVQQVTFGPFPSTSTTVSVIGASNPVGGFLSLAAESTWPTSFHSASDATLPHLGHLGFLAGLRHSHLDNAGYSIDQKVLTKRQAGADELAGMILDEERWRQVLSSLVVCFFARGIYKPEVVQKALAVTGCAFDQASLAELGKSIYARKYAFKRREGFDLEAQRIPARILQTASPSLPVTEAFLRQGLAALRQRVEAGGP